MGQVGLFWFSYCCIVSLQGKMLTCFCKKATLALLESTLSYDDGILQLLLCCSIHSYKAISVSQLVIFEWLV